MWFTFCYQVREDSASKREEALAAAEAATKDKKAAWTLSSFYSLLNALFMFRTTMLWHK
jgi:hypothetical protein